MWITSRPLLDLDCIFGFPFLGQHPNISTWGIKCFEMPPFQPHLPYTSLLTTFCHRMCTVLFMACLWAPWGQRTCLFWASLDLQHTEQCMVHGWLLRNTCWINCVLHRSQRRGNRGDKPESSPINYQEIHRPWSHRINFVQGLPLLIGNTQGLSCLDSPLHVAGPHLQGADALWLNEVGQGIGVLGSGVAEDEKRGERERWKKTE